jgi:proteasome lid subunit RPN8/RPN11
MRTACTVDLNGSPLSTRASRPAGIRQCQRTQVPTSLGNRNRVIPRCEFVIDHGLLTEVAELSIPFSNEVCGLIIGRAQGTGSYSYRVAELHFLHNLSTSGDQFVISPQEYDLAEQHTPPGEGVIGVFHTHPGTADPSPADRQTMSRLRMIWLIVGGRVSSNTCLPEWRVYESLTDRVMSMAGRIAEDSRSAKTMNADWDPTLIRLRGAV